MVPIDREGNQKRQCAICAEYRRVLYVIGTAGDDRLACSSCVGPARAEAIVKALENCVDLLLNSGVNPSEVDNPAGEN